jgi:hypothetical protein
MVLSLVEISIYMLHIIIEMHCHYSLNLLVAHQSKLLYDM